MNPESNLNPDRDQQLDRRLTSALEAAPIVYIADGFAARIMSQVQAQQPSHLRSRLGTPRRVVPSEFPAMTAPSVGRFVSYAAAFILLTGMLFAAARPEGPTHMGATILEWSLTAEFILLSLWLTLRTLITR